MIQTMYTVELPSGLVVQTTDADSAEADSRAGADVTASTTRVAL